MQLSKSMAKEWNQLLNMKSCYIGNMTGCFSETNWWSPSLQQCQFVAEATDDLELTESIMCRLKILLSRIVSQHLVLCLDQSRSQILKNNHRKHPHEEHLLKKKSENQTKNPVHFLMNLGTSHLSFISKHSWTNWQSSMLDLDSGQNLAFTFINPNLSDLRPHGTKICRRYYIARQLRTTLLFRTFLKAFLFFPLWKDVLSLKLWLSLHFRDGLQRAIYHLVLNHPAEYMRKQ